MKYSAVTKPGMADPYWYEWSVGQQYIVDILNPDSHIICVELQADVQLGLDDVVVTYDDGKTRFIQVKHTRADDTITFGDLVSVDNSKKSDKSKHSLLSELASSWNQAKDKYTESEICVFTNRKAGIITSTIRKGGGFKRPPLVSFWKELKDKVNSVDSFCDIKFPEWEKEAWEEFCGQLKDIKNDEDKLRFLKNFYIETDQADLNELGEAIKYKLQVYLGIPEEVSEVLLGKLDHALREWTVSSRESSKITLEKLYSALSVKEETYSYNHDLIPVNPFFNSRQELVNQIETDLIRCEGKVLFLSGGPGIGKTNIISKLCNKKNSIVDIRYYAYEPIDPAKEYLATDASDRVKKEVFWDTVLNQLRDKLRGKLSKYRVPVSNSFLKLEQKRSEFFRIASAYAKDENRRFVFAIDGIDHAARAGIVEETFLTTLPNPEYIPENVKILIAGQPKEDYKNYPNWLYEGAPSVKEYHVPDIQPSDIDLLVDEKCDNFSNSIKPIVSRIICKYADGNTLAAVFAVQEAMYSTDPSSLEERLKSRKLSGNIQEYYRSIWEDAKKKMQVPFVDYKMAGVFAFFNEPLSADKLGHIFKDENISCSSWNNVLKALRPLVLENNGSYTVLHNDVRVYLSGIIGQDKDHVCEVYSRLADYYIFQREKTIGYYRDVLRFLISAGRIQEFESVYCPDYVISAYVNGVELLELKRITDDLLRFAIRELELDWHKLRSLTIGYLTIDQIEKCLYEIEDICFRPTNKTISVHPYECYAIPTERWNPLIIEEVLRLVDDLFKSGEDDRGRRLFKNWFYDIQFSDIQEIVNDDKDHVDYKRIAELLGRACVNTNDFTLYEELSKLENDIFLSESIEKVEDLIINELHAEDLERALDSLDIILVDPLVSGIKRIIEQNRYRDLEAIRDSIQKRNISNGISKLLITFLKVITKKVDWTDDQADGLWDEIKSVDLPDESIENLITYYSIYAIVAAYLQNKSRSEIAQDVTSLFINDHKQKESEYILLFFNATCLLGKWLKARNGEQCFWESSDNLSHIIKNLYSKKWKRSFIDYEIYSLRAYLLKAFILLSEKEDAQFQANIKNSIEHVFENNPVNQLLDPGMLYYRKNSERMQVWIDEWLNEDGKVWSLPIGERNRIIKELYDTKLKYDKANLLSLRGAIERVKWSVIGFSSHKEYCVDYLLELYNILVEKNPKHILQYGIVVKDISDKIELIGDNRFNYLLTSKVFSDWGSCGFSQIKSMIQDGRVFQQCISQPSCLVDFLIGYLKRYDFNKEQLLTIWSVGIGLLDWRKEEDHGSISALQRAIELNARKNEVTGIRDELLRLGPAYMDLSADPLRFVIPDRWTDIKVKRDELENAKKIVFGYILGRNGSTTNAQVAEALKSLYQSGELKDSEVEEVLCCVLNEENYSIIHNSILEFLFGIGNDKNINEWVKQYIEKALDNNKFYPALDLPAFIKWRIGTKEESFIQDGLDELIHMLKCWITASNHIKEPKFEVAYDYSNNIDLDTNDVFELYIRVLLLIVVSDDADAARAALGGIAASLRVKADYVTLIEEYWENLHYRAKEWILMIYEFIYMMCQDDQESIYKCLVMHSKDDDFNAALYSKLLCESINSDYPLVFSIPEKGYFSDIPKYGYKRFILIPRNNSCINGSECVLEQKKYLEQRLQLNLDDIERRTADYSERIKSSIKLLPLFRERVAGCNVVCEEVNLAFFRVLYKDWFDNRWDGDEAEIARVVLSASEPYTLLLSPKRWEWNKGKLFNDVNDILSLTEEERNSRITELIQTGIPESETVIAGAVEDYTYEQKLYGYLLGYLDVPGVNKQLALSAVERNARLFLKERNDYSESRHLNITMHQYGIESFKQSIIMCGFSKYILMAFKWKLKYTSDGLRLVNKLGEIIGRLECYYGIRTDIANRYPANQPYVQRWVVSSVALEKATVESGCPFGIKTATGSLITDSLS